MASFPHGIDEGIPKGQRGKTREVRAGPPFDPKFLRNAHLSEPAIVRNYKVVRLSELESTNVTPIGSNSNASAQGAPKQESPYRKAAG